MKKEDTKYKVWGGKNMLKCNDCSCGNFKCEDGSRFCSRCGVWRIVLALTFLIIMFKIGYICGYQMALSDATDDFAPITNARMEGKGKFGNSFASKKATSGIDSNGCKLSEAATWSKSQARCVKLYEEARVLYDVNGGPRMSYILSKDKSKLELYNTPVKDGIILNLVADSDSWKTDDGKFTVTKNADGKLVLSQDGNVIQSER